MKPPLRTLDGVPARVIAGFWDRVDCGDQDECWAWTGVAYNNGYGSIAWQEQGQGGRVVAHRMAYMIAVGPIPEGLVLDHLCRNRMCCNPAHLEAVTQQTNILRGQGPTAINAAKKVCDYGHSLDADNLVPRQTKRECLTCKRRKAREFMRKKSAEQRQHTLTDVEAP